MSRVLARVKGSPTIFPFADSAAELLFGSRALKTLQEEEARAAGFDVVDVDEGAVYGAGVFAAVNADVVFNAAALSAVVDASASRGKIVRATVKHRTPLFTASTRLLDVNGDLALPLIAGDLQGKRGFGADEDVCVADEDGCVVVDTRPYGKAPHELRIARVQRLLGRATHWLHVLDLSLAALQTRLAHPTTTPHKPKKKPFIHPHAFVENSVIGSGVRVEAGAAIIDSVVGDDVIVADHTVIHSSVIGDGCRTLVDTHLRRVVAMPGSTLSNLDMQDAIFGREIFLTTSAGYFADAPGRDVVVDGKDSGRAVLGGAIGARTVLGSRALMRCGLALPPQLLVVARPGEALGKVDEKSLAKSLSKLGDRSRDV